MAIIIKKGSETPDIEALFTSPLQEMRLVVGLGNPGEKYALNRHNIGFMCLDKMQTTYETKWQKQNKLKTLLTSLDLGNVRLILTKPQTYVNLSGEAVSALKQYYKLQKADICLIYDEIRLPFGTIEALKTNKDFGHNGLKSIQNHLRGSLQLLRVGIGPKKPSSADLSDFVLANFTPEQQELLPKITKEVCSLLGEMSHDTLVSQTKRTLF